MKSINLSSFISFLKSQLLINSFYNNFRTASITGESALTVCIFLTSGEVVSSAVSTILAIDL